MSNLAKLYIAAIALSGMAGLAFGLGNLPRSEDLAILALLVVLCGLAQAAQVPLFSGSSVSIAFGISFVSLLLFGPAGAILTNVGAAFVHAVYPRRRAWYKSTFNASVFIVSAALAGAAYAITGGGWPVRDVTSTAGPAVAAVLTYYVVNTVLVSLVIALTTRANFVQVFKENHLWLVLYYLMIAAMGLLVPFGYQSMAWTGLVVFSLPLIIPWVFTRMYVAQAKVIIARNAELIRLKTEIAQLSEGRFQPG